MNFARVVDRCIELITCDTWIMREVKTTIEHESRIVYMCHTIIKYKMFSKHNYKGP